LQSCGIAILKLSLNKSKIIEGDGSSIQKGGYKYGKEEQWCDTELESSMIFSIYQSSYISTQITKDEGNS
jgi:hypothetical protein